MDLILKPTQRCNFSCSFCSSTSIAEEDATILDLNYVYKFLARFPNTNTIIVNGGDPLMLKPDYYWKIIKHLDDNNMPATISLTTNLWAFYKKPEMWEDLFNHPRVGVGTSFNYGNTRRITIGRVYTEEMFWKVSNLFLERIGYRPDFIAVITEENEDTALATVELAKKMDVVCKLNYAMASGDQSKPYQLSKIYKIYLDIHKAGLTEWEFNTKQMLRRLKSDDTVCPQTRGCDNNIRALNPEGDYYSCGSFADDQEYSIDFNKEMAQQKHEQVIRPLHTVLEISSLKEECYSCPLFNICNGCHKTISDMKRHNMVEDHCSLMKKLGPEIIKLNE